MHRGKVSFGFLRIIKRSFFFCLIFINFSFFSHRFSITATSSTEKSETSSMSASYSSDSNHHGQKKGKKGQYEEIGDVKGASKFFSISFSDFYLWLKDEILSLTLYSLLFFTLDSIQSVLRIEKKRKNRKYCIVYYSRFVDVIKLLMLLLVDIDFIHEA